MVIQGRSVIEDHFSSAEELEALLTKEEISVPADGQTTSTLANTRFIRQNIPGLRDAVGRLKS